MASDATVCTCKDIWGNPWRRGAVDGGMGGTQVISADCPTHGVRPSVEDPGADINEPSEPLDPETVEKLRKEHGIELPDWKPTIRPAPASVDALRSKLAGWHFAKESLTDGEREILAVAEAVLAELDRRDENGYAR